jgi:hypothetical protein
MQMIRRAALAAALSLPACATASAQTPSTPQPIVAPTPAPRPQASASHRWYDLQAINLDARYRLIQTSAGVNASNHLQHKQTVKGAFRFDPKGRYTVQGLAGSGTTFTGSWENAGPGTGDADAHFGVRHLYVAAIPVKGVEAQIGGLAIVRGESTEITSYDNDGFLMGERLSVKRPASLWLDEVSVTAGYLGDLSTPSVFERADRLDDHNYTQVLVAKKLSARATVSADWTQADGVDTWRQAVRLSAKETHVVDSVRLELYQRVTGDGAEGFAVTVERALPAKIALAGGFATIDKDYGGLNADRFNRGNRVFVDAKVPVLRDLSLNVFYGRAIHNDYAIANKTRFDVVVSYNALKALQRVGAL